MPRAINDASLRHLRVLFGGGSGAGLTDGQLLQRFAARDGLRSERAFAVLVERHGPMVLRVARSVLRDHALADDVFQNAFLALAKRARSLWVRDSIGPWLYAVTVRVATQMRAKQARRRRIDEKAASLATDSFEPGIPDDLGSALHEEISRLPDRQRQAVVLCLVEGLTHDEAARRLDWPVGTVRSRLARGRERLKGRLERRGLAPSSALLIGPGLLGRSGIEAVRGSLVSATVQGAVSATQGGLIGLVGTVPAGAIAATITVMKESAMIHRVSAVVGLLAAGVLAVGVSIPAQSKPQPAPVPVQEGSPSASSAEKKIVSRVYHVADLLKVHENLLVSMNPVEGLADGQQVMERVVRQVQTDKVDFGPLVELLTSTVAPGTWTIIDGKGPDPTPEADTPHPSITPFHLNLTLIIRHNADAHLEVQTRLRQLRGIINPLTQLSVRATAPNVEIERIKSLALEKRKTDPDQIESEIIEERIVGPEPNTIERPSTRYTLTRRVQPEKVYYGYQKVPEPSVDGPEQESVVAEPEAERASDIRGSSTDQGQRIDALERKLDTIIDELRAIRGGQPEEVSLHTDPFTLFISSMY